MNDVTSPRKISVLEPAVLDLSSFRIQVFAGLSCLSLLFLLLNFNKLSVLAGLLPLDSFLCNLDVVLVCLSACFVGLISLEVSADVQTPSKGLTAVAAACLFAFHPLIVRLSWNQVNPLSALTCLASLVSIHLFLRFRLIDEDIYLAGSLVAFLFALASSPAALVIPVIFFLLSFSSDMPLQTKEMRKRVNTLMAIATAIALIYTVLQCNLLTNTWADLSNNMVGAVKNALTDELYGTSKIALIAASTLLLTPLLQGQPKRYGQLIPLALWFLLSLLWLPNEEFLSLAALAMLVAQTGFSLTTQNTKRWFIVESLMLFIILAVQAIKS